MHSKIFIAIILVTVQALDGQRAVPNNRLNFFDIDLFRYTAEDRKGNVMVSPASIKSTLALLLEGAEGPTASEIKSALRVSPMKDDFRQELHVFLRALEANSPNVVLQNANALFVSKKLKLKKEYEDTARQLYFSEVDYLDFNDPKTSTNAINAWANNKTRGLIPTIVEEVQVTPTTEMLITNALYFKAPWKHGFDVKSTHSDCFYTNGVCRNVAMMDLEAELRYLFVKNLRAHALELPYQGDRYSMIILVPQDRDSGMAIIRDLPYIGLADIIERMDSNNVILTMPKFNIKYSENMVGALRSMRIDSLFSHSANLSGIFEVGEDPYLNSIYHSVHMEVDEEGTVAAAASVSMVVPLINDQVQLTVDRPFLFFIRDNKLGQILFEGKVEEPTEFVAPVAKDPPAIGQHNQPIPIQPFKSQEALNQGPCAIKQQSNCNQAPNFNQASQPNVNVANPPVVQTTQGPQPNLNSRNQPTVQSTQISIQPTVKQSTQSQSSTSNPTVATTSEAVEQSTKKSGHLSAWLKRLGDLF